MPTVSGQSNWERARAGRERGSLRVGKSTDNQQESTVPIVFISRPTAEKLFQGEIKINNKRNSKMKTDSI